MKTSCDGTYCYEDVLVLITSKYISIWRTPFANFSAKIKKVDVAHMTKAPNKK